MLIFFLSNDFCITMFKILNMAINVINNQPTYCIIPYRVGVSLQSDKVPHENNLYIIPNSLKRRKSEFLTQYLVNCGHKNYEIVA